MMNTGNKSILNSCRGFSLLEVLLGVTVFMIGMLGVTALSISSLKSNTFSGNMSEAVIIAGDKIEELMSSPFADPLLAAGDHFEDPDNDGVIDPVGKKNIDGEGIYYVYWNVIDGDPLPDRTKTVNVTVEWFIKDVKRSMSLSTIILDAS